MHKPTRYIVIVLVVILAIYLAFLDTLAKPIFEQQATEMYGAEVSIDSLNISPFLGKVTLHNVQVADRRNAMRNLTQADRAHIDIDMLKLAQDILELDVLEIDGLVMLARRSQPAVILRPLVAADSGIATAGLPTFELPDADALIAQQREKLDADIAEFKSAITEKQLKWQKKIATLPTQADIDGYKARIKQLTQSQGVAGKLAALRDAQKLYADVNRDAEAIQSMRAEFRGDLQLMRENVDMASALSQNHVDQLIMSLGLSSEQMAQIGSRLLRGDLSGLFQQVLAPLAYNASGAADSSDDMPIYIGSAKINGSILPSAAGFSAVGHLENFTWPLDLSDLPAVLKLEGNSVEGGSMLIDAVLDHRQAPRDTMVVLIENLSLRNMVLAGTDELSIKLDQTLANVSGELKVDGDALSGGFTQQLTKTLFTTELAENAGDSARLIAAVLDASSEFKMQTTFSGTLQSPEIGFSADLDQLIERTLRNAISEKVSGLTAELGNQISSEIGPEIASAREQFTSLEQLQKELEAKLQQLSKITK
jgi:hypothetical protein